MDWNKLTDRCRVFEPGVPRPLLKNLLQEGEEELAKLVSLYERKVHYTAPFIEYYGATDSPQVRNVEWVLLPKDFSRMKWVYINGRPIEPEQQNESYKNTLNEVDDGTPTGYYVHNDKLYFNRIPSSDDNILIEYFSNLTSALKEKQFTVNSTMTIEVDTDEPTDLFVVSGTQRAYTDTTSNVRSTESRELSGIRKTDLINHLDSKINTPTNREDFYGFAIDTDLGDLLNGSLVIYNGTSNTITDTGELTSPVGQFYFTDGALPAIGDIVLFPNYRDIAPIIPDQYHKELCYYALNVSTNNDQYLQKWMAFITMVQEQDMNRDLIHSIKEVI